MIVLRLENEYGQGIYTSGLATQICYEMDDPDLAHDTFGPHPTPSYDSRLIAEGYNKLVHVHYLFAFTSFEQYRAWFFNDEFLNHLGEHNISLALYEVEHLDMIIGNAQCVFDPGSAMPVGRFDPLTPKEDLPL